jgi:hypothetical protein
MLIGRLDINCRRRNHWPSIYLSIVAHNVILQDSAWSALAALRNFNRSKKAARQPLSAMPKSGDGRCPASGAADRHGPARLHQM